MKWYITDSSSKKCCNCKKQAKFKIGKQYWCKKCLENVVMPVKIAYLFLGEYFEDKEYNEQDLFQSHDK